MITSGLSVRMKRHDSSIMYALMSMSEHTETPHLKGYIQPARLSN